MTKVTKRAWFVSGSELAFVAAMAVCLAAYADGAYTWSRKNITVTGTASLTVTNAEMQVDVASGGVATLDLGQPVTVRARAGGSVVLRHEIAAHTWTNKVALWLDASKTSTMEPFINNGVVRTTTDPNGRTTDTIMRWRDCRPGQTTWLGYNNRGKTGDNQPGTMPFVVSNGCNNLSYVSLGTLGAWGRRLPIIKVVDGVEMDTPTATGLYNASYQLKGSYVIMVFGSQNGGGNHVISDIARGTTGTSAAADVPLFMYGERATMIDGEEVDPTKTGLNGGWQIISFATKSSDTIKGLGYKFSNGTDYYGGQNYAEVLVFTNMPSVAEIATVERYLAEKWGVATYSGDHGVRLYGSGSTSVESGVVSLGGEFSGTLAVAAGATAKLTDTHLVPTSPAAGMTGWYDPCRTDKTTIFGPGTPTNAYRISSLANLSGVKTDGKNYNLVGGGRSPYFFDEARGWGPVRRWYDYRKSLTYQGESAPGNTTRFNDAGKATGETLPVRTGFIVLDTSAGGGTPFLDTSVYYQQNGSDPGAQYIQHRIEPWSPIFSAKDGAAAAFVTNSPTFLDGKSVVGRVHKFNYRPELLSFAFTETLPLKCFGDWQQSTDSFELRHGEIVLYPGAITDEARRDTEAYLMKKWLGITPCGYGDASLMTVAGAGTVKTADGAPRPKVGAGFTGTLDVTGGTVAFTVDTSASSPVLDAIEAPNGTVTTEESLTINLSFARQPDPGVYTLVSAGTLNAPQQVSLGTVAGAIDMQKAVLAVARSGNALLLSVMPRGTIILFR